MFLDSLSANTSNPSFKEFCQEGDGSKTDSINSNDDDDEEGDSRPCRFQSSKDADVFLRDILSKLPPSGSETTESFTTIIWSYALEAWFDTLQSLEDQLDNISPEPLPCNTSGLLGQSRQLDEERPERHDLLHEEGMKNAILRYLSSLHQDIDRLDMEITSAQEVSRARTPSAELTGIHDTYKLIQQRMEVLLARIQHSLDLKNAARYEALTKLQIEESRKCIQEAETCKRYVPSYLAFPSKTENMYTKATSTRLTILGLIYIPLFFVCSVFGMNINQLDSHPSVWIFLAVAISVSAAITIAALYSLIWRLFVGIYRFILCTPNYWSDLRWEPRETLRRLAQISKLRVTKDTTHDNLW